MKEKFAKQKNVHKFSVGNYVSVKVLALTGAHY